VLSNSVYHGYEEQTPAILAIARIWILAVLHSYANFAKGILNQILAINSRIRVPGELLRSNR
jgi:hypothetical protein